MEFTHIPVLFHETLDSLQIRPDGLYVDCTAGGGGHSKAIAERLTTGRLIAIDRDPDAIAILHERLGNFPQVQIVQNTYDNIRSVLNGERADGILADLGVSSYQLDTAQRGFSFHKDAPLDMRMSCQGLSAADIVNTLPEQELADIIYKYGEEKKSRQIAANIVKARSIQPIETTKQLADLIYGVIRKTPNTIDPATRTFQALRIAVNNELQELENGLKGATARLNPNGRLVVVTFHSLEDRIVKNFFKENSGPRVHVSKYAKDAPVVDENAIFAETSKVISASEEEIKLNARSRSAKLRWGQKKER